jgi:putative solute:sodium symporter small subunit
MADQSHLEVNFFKPKSEATRANTRIISILVLIWAVAVFGFQFLLLGIGKPVPEQTYVEFTALWPKVQQMPQLDESQPATPELQQFARVLLYTLGKNTTLAAADRERVVEALSVTVHLLNPAAATGESAAERIGLGDSGFDPLLKEQLLYHYKNSQATTFSGLNDLPDVMATYLVHNRSLLTDTTFLGFPLHYYYTAQFLLILFIILCLVYAKAVDKKNTRLGIEED